MRAVSEKVIGGAVGLLVGRGSRQTARLNQGKLMNTCPINVLGL
jgi:hypothetical protein